MGVNKNFDYRIDCREVQAISCYSHVTHVISLIVHSPRLYTAIPAIPPLFNACVEELFWNGLQLPRLIQSCNHFPSG